MKKVKNEISNLIIRVVLYIRVSTEEQAKHGYSIESQKARLLEYCEQQGYKVVGIYIDEGKSARTKLSNRKELMRLLNDAKEDKFDRIIMWRLDRWFRNVKDYYKVQDELDKYKIDWECSDEDFNTSTSNGRLYLNIKLSIAQNESDQTSDRIKFNFENMIKNKRPIFGNKALPIGYIVGGEKRDKRVIKDPDTEQMTIDMFDVYERTMSLNKTTQYLNEHYPDRPIGYEAVKRFLKKTLYYGKYRDVENYCEAYVTKERWDNIQDLLRKNYKNNKAMDHEYIFSGLIKCCDCGRKMTGSTTKYFSKKRNQMMYRPTYRCAKHFLDCRCSNAKVLTEWMIEEWLLNNFENELNHYIVEIKEIKEKSERDNNTVKIKKLENKLDRLNDLYIDGKITREKYDTDYSNIRSELNTLKLQTDKTETIDLVKYEKILNNKKAIDLYNNLNIENKRVFWNNFIDYIVQDGEGYNFKIFFK